MKNSKHFGKREHAGYQTLGKTLHNPSLVLVKPRKYMNNVNCRRDMTEILLKVAKTAFNQLGGYKRLSCQE